MVETADAELFNKTLRDSFKKSFEDVEQEAIFGKKPLIYCHFATGLFLLFYLFFVRFKKITTRFHQMRLYFEICSQLGTIFVSKRC